MLAELAAKISFDFLEVQWLQAGARSAVDALLIPDDLSAQGLGEAANRLPEVTLEELHHRRREVKPVRPLQDVLLRELIGCHPLGEVADHLGGGRDLQCCQTLTSPTNSPYHLP